MRTEARLLTVLVVTFCSLAACGKTSANGSDAAGIMVSTDSGDASKRLTVDNQTVTIDAAGTGASTSLDLVSVVTLLQVGIVIAPTVSGTVLQADSVAVSGSMAYVGYNAAGNSGLGAIDAINVLVPAIPVLSSTLTSTVGDFNGLTVNGSTLYAVGENPAATNTAFLMTIGLSAGTPTSTTHTYNLPSYAGTDVTANSNYVYATSGDTGGLTTFTASTMAQTNYTAISDARAVRVNPNDSTVRVLSGQPGTMTALTAAGITPTATALGGNTTADAKSTIEVDTTWTLAALGSGGFKVLCTANSATLATVAEVSVSGQTAANTVTNAVAASVGNLIFAADGQGGVFVYQAATSGTATPCPAVTVTLVGSLNFGTTLSANAVYTTGGLLFVVDGLGGFRILTVTAI